MFNKKKKSKNLGKILFAIFGIALFMTDQGPDKIVEPSLMPMAFADSSEETPSLKTRKVLNSKEESSETKDCYRQDPNQQDEEDSVPLEENDVADCM